MIKKTLYLEICRGLTKSPCRPVRTGRFLIGAGPHCDLRLGGRQMPILHSILLVDGCDVLLEAVASTPPLKVNGEITQSVRLKDGDLIEIGSIEFFARHSQAIPSTQIAPATANGVEDLQAARFVGGVPNLNEVPKLDEVSDLDEVPKLDELTALELNDLIEAEQHAVEQFEGKREMGAAALLQTALERARTTVSRESDNADLLPLPIASTTIAENDSSETNASASDALELQLLEDLERVVKQLDRYSEQLEQQAEQLSRREAGYAKASAELLDAQQQLASQLNSVLEHLEPQAIRDIKTQRAIA
jgi:hypothetical protein